MLRRIAGLYSAVRGSHGGQSKLTPRRARIIAAVVGFAVGVPLFHLGLASLGGLVAGIIIAVLLVLLGFRIASVCASQSMAERRNTYWTWMSFALPLLVVAVLPVMERMEVDSPPSSASWNAVSQWWNSHMRGPSLYGLYAHDPFKDPKLSSGALYDMSQGISRSGYVEAVGTDAGPYRVVVKGYVDFLSAAFWEDLFVDFAIRNVEAAFRQRTAAYAHLVEELRAEMYEVYWVTVTPATPFQRAVTEERRRLLYGVTFSLEQARKIEDWSHFFRQCREDPRQFIQLCQDVHPSQWYR